MVREQFFGLMGERTVLAAAAAGAMSHACAAQSLVGK
jgi:hypothetical protein